MILHAAVARLPAWLDHKVRDEGEVRSADALFACRCCCCAHNYPSRMMMKMMA